MKHPRADALALSHGEKPMPEADRRKSEWLTDAILKKRGREALRADDASAGAESESAKPKMI